MSFNGTLRQRENVGFQSIALMRRARGDAIDPQLSWALAPVATQHLRTRYATKLYIQVLRPQQACELLNDATMRKPTGPKVGGHDEFLGEMLRWMWGNGCAD